jgi:GT2 family glycosyltransferase
LQLSIIIVNYKSAKLISDCLQSAFLYPSAKNFEWIIVDNNSNDGSKEYLTTKYPFINWVEMQYNAGFARANNAGIMKSSGDIILLLNPDTIIVDDCINNCLERFLGDAAVATSVQLINPDGSPQITGNYFMKGGLNHLLPLPYLGKILRAVAFSMNLSKTNTLNPSSYQKVDWINGAFLMVKKTFINIAGLMDEDFFLYAEEAEWCSRLNKQGDLVVYGDLKIIHLQGETINEETKTFDKGYFDLYTKKGLQLIVSNNLRIRKQYGVGWFLFNLIIYIIEIPFYLCCLIVHSIFFFRNPLPDLKKFYGYSRNVFKLILLSPGIILKKKYLFRMI